MYPLRHQVLDDVYVTLSGGPDHPAVALAVHLGQVGLAGSQESVREVFFYCSKGAQLVRFYLMISILPNPAATCMALSPCLLVWLTSMEAMERSFFRPSWLFSSTAQKMAERTKLSSWKQEKIYINILYTSGFFFQEQQATLFTVFSYRIP